MRWALFLCKKLLQGRNWKSRTRIYGLLDALPSPVVGLLCLFLARGACVTESGMCSLELTHSTNLCTHGVCLMDVPLAAIPDSR